MQRRSKILNYKKPFSMNKRERESHVRGVYLMHTGHIVNGTRKGENKEENADDRIIVKNEKET